MKIIITDHGRQRLKERVKCNPDKYDKIIRKALLKKGDQIKPLNKMKLKCGSYDFVKYLLGYIFVFSWAGKDAVKLITVYNPKIDRHIEEKK